MAAGHCTDLTACSEADTGRGVLSSQPTDAKLPHACTTTGQDNATSDRKQGGRTVLSVDDVSHRHLSIPSVPVCMAFSYMYQSCIYVASPVVSHRLWWGHMRIKRGVLKSGRVRAVTNSKLGEEEDYWSVFWWRHAPTSSLHGQR